MLILAGGGHAHVEVLRRFGLTRAEGLRLILISPDTHTAYSGMLPGHLAGHYTWDDCHLDLRKLCRRAGAEFVMTRVDGIDPDGRQVRCANGHVLAIDALTTSCTVIARSHAAPGYPIAPPWLHGVSVRC